MIYFDEILLIDDDNTCNFFTSKILGKVNIANFVLPFLEAKSALAHIAGSKENDSDLKNLILLDINMPVMNGWDFLNEFEKLPKSVLDRHIVMILSSSIANSDIEKSKTYESVKKFISKPLTMDKILTELKN